MRQDCKVKITFEDFDISMMYLEIKRILEKESEEPTTND